MSFWFRGSVNHFIVLLEVIHFQGTFLTYAEIIWLFSGNRNTSGRCCTLPDKYTSATLPRGWVSQKCMIDKNANVIKYKDVYQNWCANENKTSSNGLQQGVSLVAGSMLAYMNVELLMF